MTCSEFIESFSDHIDETGPPDLRRAAHRHRDGCASCRRYEEVYLRARDTLVEVADEVELDDDFHDRLQHRLFHVDDERALARSAPALHPSVMVLGAGVLLASLAAGPLLEPEPEVELSPIVVSRPAHRPLGLRIPLPSLLPASLSPAALELDGDDLWRQSASLFYEYAPVRARYRDASPTRQGLQ